MHHIRTLLLTWKKISHFHLYEGWLWLYHVRQNYDFIIVFIETLNML